MYDLYLKMRPYFDYKRIAEYKLKENEYIVCTIHRDFNTDNPENLKNILDGLERISKDIQVVFPMHPRTKKMIAQFGFEPLLKNITVMEPLDYLSMMGLLKNCFMVITDSGGLQKEAYFAGKRAIVVMPDTGWRELIEIGWNKLVDSEELYRVYKLFVDNRNFKVQQHIYGEGNSGEKIVRILKN